MVEKNNNTKAIKSQRKIEAKSLTNFADKTFLCQFGYPKNR